MCIKTGTVGLLVILILLALRLDFFINKHKSI